MRSSQFKPGKYAPKTETRIVVEDLPEEEWYQCTICNGTGCIHDSVSTIPCPQCHKGIVKTRTIRRRK